MESAEIIKLPRLYINDALQDGRSLALPEASAHYLRNVLRRSAGDAVRLFNGRDGEWLAALTSVDKKAVVVKLTRRLKNQPAPRAQTHLLFAPLKKDAQNFLVEKAVELGVTHLHPILTQNTENRRLNDERVRQQIIEAAEQCERLDIPELIPLADMTAALDSWPADTKIYAALERTDAAPLPAKYSGNSAFLIGPEGGFTVAERAALAARPFIIPVTLGDTILRAETAALFCLSARRHGDMS